MKVIFYSTKDFEQPFLETADKHDAEVKFIAGPLSLESAEKASGFDIVSIFTADDASAPVMETLSKVGVKYISTRAAGYDNIDLPAAVKLGIAVANVPAYSPYSVAEHAAALVMALNRKLIISNNQVHNHDFTTGKLIGFDLHGKTVGVIGAGIIGSVFIKIMYGFGCRIIANDLVENEELKKLYKVEYVTPDYLYSNSDIISLHVAFTPKTKYLVNKKSISLMKPGVMLINTGRGGCVNTSDVIEALESGQIGFFGADVYENERGIFFCDHSANKFEDPILQKLLDMPNVLVTPHQAFATKEALKNIADTTFENIAAWVKGVRAMNELTG